MNNNRVIVLDSRPEGTPTNANFKFENQAQPEPKEGEVLLKAKYVSVDPYLRGRMTTAKSYIPPFEVGQPLASGIIAEVVASHNDKFPVGQYVNGMLQWAEYQVSDGKGLTKVDATIASPSAYLGVLGLTGLTAHLGLMEIGKPKAGETVVVSGAAGAVGSIVGQVAKIIGCRVVGIAGSDEKVQYLKEKLGFDEVLNYNSTSDITEAIGKACPDGVDVYFDNVGGSISDAVYAHINRLARIVLCGSISVYNETSVPMGPRVETNLIKRSALMQGFILSDFAEKFPSSVQQIAQWLQEGKIKQTETIKEGFENIPQAFIDLFSGGNKGKMVVKVD
ncbi:hypothetical protein CLV98_11532 [Dyadobacter jejuensis]|uniref:Enoyl reductase (ER) domain-containing protein n=1 Tax=Dyadobacter jejuensis TaxID=1082580 RepID=A0A316ABC4_9BACT|nr:NADP-dependent oxidoreductase [Dyadobacter jejuensis]PWJ55013.1 hypothetical protein CLV98_11532 [Dyadobacter jejuensis]